MPEYDFQSAKSEMDLVLMGLKQEVEGNNIYGVKVPLNHPWLINRGKNSLVFKLPNFNLVAKSSFYELVSADSDKNKKGYFMLAGYQSGLTAGGLEMTIESLQAMGFGKERGISFPEMQEHGRKINMWHHKVVNYTLIPDLQENGRYQLNDAEGFDFNSHNFGDGLRRLYEKSCKEILQACKSGSYNLTCAGHGSEEDPEPAIRHIFLIQFNDEQGKLVIADLNHLVIRKKK